MTRQTSAPLKHTSLQASNRSAREIAGSMVEAGWLDLNAPYQRASVWSEDQRIALVRSWLLGLPVPAVLFNSRATTAWTAENGTDVMETGQGLYGVVDGKQRIETAIAWFNGDL